MLNRHYRILNLSRVFQILRLTDIGLNFATYPLHQQRAQQNNFKFGSAPMMP